MRRFVIGDIHGCAKALRTVIEKIAPGPDDQIIFLGDYIDRGVDTKDVVAQVVDLQSQCRVVALKGNHELMLLAILRHGIDEAVWLANGGRATVTSYGGKLSKIPDDHLEFFSSLRSYYETDKAICIHAGYDPECPMNMQDEAVMYWNHLPATIPAPHQSGKRVFIGHTPQPLGNVLDCGHVVCVDTYCFGGGYLTAFDLDNDQVIQANLHGHLRRDRKGELRETWRRMRGRFSEFVHGKVDGTREIKEGLPSVAEIEKVKLKIEN